MKLDKLFDFIDNHENISVILIAIIMGIIACIFLTIIMYIFNFKGM